MKYRQFKKFSSYLQWYEVNMSKINIITVKMKFKKNNDDVIKVWFKEVDGSKQN